MAVDFGNQYLCILVNYVSIDATSLLAPIFNAETYFLHLNCLFFTHCIDGAELDLYSALRAQKAAKTAYEAQAKRVDLGGHRRMDFFKRHRLLALLSASSVILCFAYGISKLTESAEVSERTLYADPARQIAEDISQALALSYQLKTYSQWLDSGFTPEEIFRNARELRASRVLCSSLSKLNDHDLTYFDSTLRNESSSRFLHCRNQLLAKLNRSWKTSMVELNDYVVEHLDQRKLPKFTLCFHGGPDPARTPELLKLLKKSNLKASFFVTPERARKFPSIVKRMIREGHQVGAMGWGDVGVTAYGSKKVPDAEKSHRDILRTQDLIISTLGPRTSMEVLFPRAGTLTDSSTLREDLGREIRRSGLRIHPEHLEAYDWKYRNPTELFRSVENLLQKNATSSERFPVSLAFSDQFEQTLIVVEKLVEVGKPVSQTLRRARMAQNKREPQIKKL